MVTERQVSSGGVVYRRTGGGVDVAIVLVGDKRRWQLPKGIVDQGETPDVTAVREAREEAGVESRVVDKIDTIEYWYVSTRDGARVRYHKFVHFYLLEYVRGEVDDHDHEVLEARWVAIGDARAMLAFPNERKIMDRAIEMLGGEAADGS